jgi:KDO2-lipid IV(A) lauroyltransferase
LSIVEWDGEEHSRTAAASGRGILYVTAHFGNWEVFGVAHGYRATPIGVVARPLDNARLDERLCAFRRVSGNTVISKWQALQAILRLIRSGEGLAILIDQNVQERDGVFVEFFGRPAATTTVAAAVALKTGCVVMPVWAELLPNGRYRLHYDPPLSWESSGDRRTDIVGLTQALTSRIERWVRERPEQWLWIHRRWKTQPTGSAKEAGSPGGAPADAS